MKNIVTVLDVLETRMNFFPVWLIRVRVFAGNYRTQLYDKQREEYLPATQGLGMFVEVKDPDDKVQQLWARLFNHVSITSYGSGSLQDVNNTL